MNARVPASHQDMMMPTRFLHTVMQEEGRRAPAAPVQLALVPPLPVPVVVAEPVLETGFRALAEKFGDLSVGKSLVAAAQMLANLPGHLRLQRALAHAALAASNRAGEQMGYKYLRTTYLGHQFPVRQRLAVSLNHHQYMTQRFREAFFVQAKQEGCPLWQAGFGEGDETMHCDIVLRFPEYYNFDGDLCLAFRVDQKDVYVITFSIAPAATTGAQGGQALLISGIQGINGKIDLIRKATEYCNEVSPPHLLIAAAEALALSLDIGMLVGIGSNPALNRDGDAARGRYAFNYDNFWQPIAGEKSGSNLYHIPLPFIDKPIEAVQSKHRSRALRRRESRNKMRGEIIAAAGARLRAEYFIR